MRNPNAKVSDPNKFITDCGSDVHVLYKSELCPNGEIRLTPSGKESISEKINAEKKFTDISYIRTRLMMGDTSVLRDGAMYGDFTQCPKTLAEHLQLFISARKEFDNLDLETKNKFDNNYMNWLQTAGTEDWAKKMNLFSDVPEEIIKEEVVNNES